MITCACGNFYIFIPYSYNHRIFGLFCVIVVQVYYATIWKHFFPGQFPPCTRACSGEAPGLWGGGEVFDFEYRILLNILVILYTWQKICLLDPIGLLNLHDILRVLWSEQELCSDQKRLAEAFSDLAMRLKTAGILGKLTGIQRGDGKQHHCILYTLAAVQLSFSLIDNIEARVMYSQCFYVSNYCTVSCSFLSRMLAVNPDKSSKVGFCWFLSIGHFFDITDILRVVKAFHRTLRKAVECTIEARALIASKRQENL